MRPDIACLIRDVLLGGQVKGFYDLESWVVMPNHIHVVVFPYVDLARVVSAIKAGSARQANRVLNRTGAFWSRDYFDRWIRDSAEERRIVRYIENNPVKAGLCREPAEWRFSSASPERA